MWRRKQERPPPAYEAVRLVAEVLRPPDRAAARHYFAGRTDKSWSAATVLPEKLAQYGGDFCFAFCWVVCDVLFPAEMFLDGWAIEAAVVEAFG